MPHTHYFLTLRAATVPQENHAEWQLQMEGIWEETLAASAHVSADDYCVRGAQLYAIAAVEGNPAQSEQALTALLEAFTQRTAQPPLAQQWRSPHRLRRLTGRSELASARDFIVQCILGEEFTPGMDP